LLRSTTNDYHIPSNQNKKITCIPNNMEKYLSFSIGNLRFLDSYQFMGSSLETLVDNLTRVEGEKHFKQFRKAFPSVFWKLC
jgi:hypothetical protein